MRLRRNNKIERCEPGYLFDPDTPFDGVLEQVGFEVQSAGGSYDVLFWRQMNEHITQEGIAVWDRDEGNWLGSSEPPDYKLSIAWHTVDLKILTQRIIKEIDEYKDG